MDVDQELARAQLAALAAVPGALKVVTAVVRPDLRAEPAEPRSGLHPDHDPDLLRLAATMVCSDVTRLDGPNQKGQYTAYTADGDWCLGMPTALLRRLQEWRG